ncbi:phosphotransferase [Micromonospora sp. PLK6-60]|uniref:phosphotransferase n=1 Tax=Micromonospora sp. PLK6-60 TaxID=2873383 RepID=UPI001CA6E2CE|nr:phosphotransferase [Micromonospora sp. PLK6-60]MBY8875913.1 phosphotransferase [Micromonospora sp. PLK6-60]
MRTLLAEQHPDLAGREIAEPFEGFDMAVFRLGDDLAVRMPRHRASAASLQSEIRWVGQLGERWTFPTQRIVREGRPGAGYPWGWAVTSWLPGELAADRPLDPAAAPALGRALAEIHQPAPVDAPFNSEQSIPLAAREPALRQVLPKLPAVGAGRGLVVDLDAAAALWRRASGVPDDAARVWAHADLHPFNVISVDGQFGGIIDWSDICGADPAVDLGFLHLLLPAAAVATAYDSYGGVDPATVARARGVGLVKAATLAVVQREVVAAVGWGCLVELGVARPA